MIAVAFSLALAVLCGPQEEAAAVRAQESPAVADNWRTNAPGLVHAKVSEVAGQSVTTYLLETSNEKRLKPTIVLAGVEPESLDGVVPLLLDALRSDESRAKTLDAFRWVLVPDLCSWGLEEADLADAFPVGWMPPGLDTRGRRPTTPLATAGSRAFAEWLIARPEIVALIALDGPDRGGQSSAEELCPLGELLRNAEALRCVRNELDGGWLDFAREARGIPTLTRDETVEEPPFVRELFEFLGSLPRTSLELSKVENLGTGMWQVDIEVTNHGRLPLVALPGRGHDVPLLSFRGVRLLALAARDDSRAEFTVVPVRGGAQVLGDLAGGARRTLRLVLETEGETGKLDVTLAGSRTGSSRLEVPLELQ